MTGHECSGTTSSDLCGAALNACIELPDGELWVTNGEYASRVNYCPYCGFEAAEKTTPERGWPDEVRRSEYRAALEDD